jgi:tetratricopeptide (TPR) repeat protein
MFRPSSPLFPAIAQSLKQNFLRLVALSSLVLLSVLAIVAQSTSTNAPTSASAEKVAADLDARLARFKPIKMPFHDEGLSPKEIQLVHKLVDAANCVEQIYWRQSDPEGLKLYLSLQASTKPEDVKLRHFLKINGSRYDLVDEMKPFVGTDPAPPGRALYPAGLTREDIEKYVQQHPDQKKAVYGEFTVVRKKGDSLVAIPYHVEFADFLKLAATALREAADLSDDPGFAKFLRLRADALLTDDYYQSDIAWLDLKNPKFDLILAPYETYLDNLLGVKTSYGAALLIRNELESKKLEMYQKYVPDLQEALPLDKADLPSKRGHLTPMEVMDAPFRTGDLLHGYQAVADNLPNDARVHAAKGSKKIFFKNFMDARVNEVILPLAQRMMREDQAVKASGNGYLASTLMHEISHELGPNYSRTTSGQREIREAIGGTFSGLEEAKADVVGMFGLHWLQEHRVITKETLEEDYISYVAGNLRTIRFGIAEPHGRAEMMEFSYLSQQGAITRDPATGRYAVVLEKMPPAIAALAKELLEQESTGDRARSEAWFTKYAVIPPELQAALAKVSDIPVDVEPIYSFKETIQ